MSTAQETHKAVGDIPYREDFEKFITQVPLPEIDLRMVMDGSLLTYSHKLVVNLHAAFVALAVIDQALPFQLARDLNAIMIITAGTNRSITSTIEILQLYASSVSRGRSLGVKCGANNIVERMFSDKVIDQKQRETYRCIIED